MARNEVFAGEQYCLGQISPTPSETSTSLFTWLLAFNLLLFSNRIVPCRFNLLTRGVPHHRLITVSNDRVGLSQTIIIIICLYLLRIEEDWMIQVEII